MVEDLELEPGDRVLDLGCGIGLWCGWLAEEVAPGGWVVGADINPASIGIARERTRADAYSDAIEYVVGDAGAIPFENESLDILFCANTLEYFADPCRYLHEELFDDRSERFLLSQPDFYYFDAETLTVGVV
jgi:ubiquinone/menaquinone biosynthesis C-methylase UbiE